MTDAEERLIETALRWDGGPPARGLWDAICALRTERGLPQEKRWTWLPPVPSVPVRAPCACCKGQPGRGGART